MRRGTLTCVLLFSLCAGAAGLGTPARAADLANAPAEELLRVYQELRHLRGSDQWAVAENAVWKRDAGTFTFRDGRLTFAAPVAGRVLAAIFTGQGTFELDPPTAIDKRQIARFAKGPRLEDSFREAVFFFTDNSWEELEKLVRVRAGGDAQKVSKILESAENKYAENFNDWWENQRKGNFPMRNLAARMLADLADPSSRGFFLADFRGERSGDLLFQISWNRDLLLMPGLSNDEEEILLHYNRGNYYEWWSGFHVSGEYARRNRPEHRKLLAHCRQEKIDAEVGRDRKIFVTAEMEFEVPAGRVRVLPLSLEGVLRVSAVTHGEGKKLSFIQEPRNLDSDLWIILPEPAAAEKIYKLRIAYEEDSTRDSRVVHQQGSGLYYVTARESWYPSFGAYDDRTSFSLSFRSPKKFKFVGTGRRTSSEKAGDFLETVWESEIPYSVAGFNYGDFVDKSQSDPELTVTAYSGREIPDELQGLQAAISTEEFRGGPGHGDLAARAGILIGGFNTARSAARAAAESYQAFKLFEAYFGVLPFKSISVTEQPIRGYAQSWPTLIFLPYDSLLDATTRNNLRIQDTAEAREFYDIVAVHEMAHQWWGHMVGWKTYHDQWLSEGFADFSAALYLKKFDPKRFKSFWDLKRRHLLLNNRAGHRPVDVGPLWLNYQTNAYPAERNSTVLIYEKGAYVLEMLRTLLEDPKSPNPDARFIAMMRDFVTTCTAQNPSTEDFRRVVEKHMNQAMDWFFNEWVYGTEVPHYEFNYDLKPGSKGQTVLHFTLSQSEVTDSFVMRVPLYIHLSGQPRRIGFLNVKGPSTFSGDIPLPVRPEKVTLDETHSILCTIRQ